MSGLNRDDIIRMALYLMDKDGEAGDCFRDSRGREEFIFDSYGIEQFANLVAAAERERIKWDSIHTCNPHCDRPACVAVRRAREDEREMCAKVCEAEGERVDSSWVSCAAAIRARGQE